MATRYQVRAADMLGFVLQNFADVKAGTTHAQPHACEGHELTFAMQFACRSGLCADLQISVSCLWRAQH